MPASLGGIIHTYQKYDPQQFPSPSQPPPDMVSPAFEHLLAYGDLRELTDEELARAVELDVTQIAGLGPSLESLKQMLLERKRKILGTYETTKVVKASDQAYRGMAETLKPPKKLQDEYRKAVQNEQIRDLERLWYRAGEERSAFARQLLQLVEQLGAKYQIDELASKYEFTGKQSLTVSQALEVKEELETIDKLLQQIEEAMKNAQVATIDMDDLARFASEEQMSELAEMQRRVQELLRQLAEQQGLVKDRKGYELTPQAYKIFQGRLLQRIFSQLQASRTGRHQGPIIGDGAVEMAATKEYEFGDAVSHMDIPSSLVNAMLRDGPTLPIRLRQDDIVIHRTRNNPKCATAVLMDMSGSMRYGGLYINVKRMALALHGLITREYPGDYLQFIEMATFAKPRHASELVQMMPKPVTISNPVVRLRADMSQPDMSESLIPPHFTNIQHALAQARQFLNAQPTTNKQVILITDGLPTAHFEGSQLYLLYPSDTATERATMREARLCQQAGITINLFLLSSWSQTSDDVRFAHRLAESTKGRVFFTAGRDLDRYVVWDYIERRKSIVS